MFEGLFQPMHLLVLAGIALLVFGPKKLPELGKGLGEGLRGFKAAMSGDDKPAQPVPPTTPTEPPNKPRFLRHPGQEGHSLLAVLFSSDAPIPQSSPGLARFWRGTRSPPPE